MSPKQKNIRRRVLKKSGVHLREIVGMKVLHGWHHTWAHSVNTIESIAPSGRIVIRFWKGLRVIPWGHICKIYPDTP